ncbi:Uncharacterised protein [Vibrio cholerae]|uniref:Uncharacterized protein n=1 Tax=Vibrio cholerae TaxID=666 RepID=A0A655UNY6_VIBCL|nr:Uncharacterised protein [Vibrio cholerae]
MVRRFGNAVRNKIDNVQAADVIFLKQIGRVRLLLTENRHQHVGSRHFASTGRLHVEHRALQYALETQRRLCLASFVIFGDKGRGLVDKSIQLTA